MATCLEIITGAVLELGAVALGDPLPAEEADRGLTVLQAMYLEAVEQGKFGRVADYLATDDYEAEEQQRVFAAGFTITLPDTVEDDSTGEDRKPRDLCMVQVVDDGAAPQISIYDAHAGDWVRLDSLTLAGTAPLGGRNRHGLECALAVRLIGSIRGQLSPAAAGVAATFAASISHRTSAPRTRPDVEYY